MEEEKKDYYSKAIDEAKQWEAFYQQSVQELATEERYKNYFSQFSPDSVKQFISYYATRKVSWYRYGDSNNDYEKNKTEQWYKMAVPLFVSIQRKKVVDVILRWGNYELKVPEARSFRDFNKWLCNPFVCPYITRVQPDEVEVAVRFLQSLGDEERFIYRHHEYYNIAAIPLLGMEDIELDEDYYPSFFRYWDDVYNTPLVRKMPERIQKERDYVDAYREYKKQGKPPKPKQEPKTGKPALAHYDRKIMDAFVQACEPTANQRMYQLQKWWRARNSFSEKAEREMEYLSNSPRHLPIESHDDWRKALARTAEQYTRDRVAYYLPIVYQEYQQRLIAGDTFIDWLERKDNTDNAWYANYLNDLLEGRKLMNEPADFNF